MDLLSLQSVSRVVVRSFDATVLRATSMLHFRWLTRLREQWFGKLSGGSPRRNRPRTRQCLYRRLELERLENRIVPSITLLNSYQGINLDSSSGGYVPPDTQGGAGPNSYVETTNSTVAMYGKTSGTTIAQDSLSDFFFTQGGLTNVGGLGDAFSAYDPLAGRFIVGDIDVDFSTGNNALTLAVSKSNNPATLTKSDWNFYEISTNEPGVQLQDYPGNLGYNDESVVITFNYFGSSGSHVFVNAFSINALTSGATLTKGTNYFQTDFNGWSLRPTAMQDSTNPNDPMWFVEESGDNKSINVVKMDGVLSSTPTFTTTNLGVNPYSTAVPELNPNGTQINGNTDSRIMNASMENGLLVAAHQVSDAAGNLDEIQWYEINTSGSAPTLQQQGDLSGGAGSYYAYPGIAIDSGGLIGMSYIASGPASGYMSTYVTGRTPNDPTGTMETPVLAMAGTVTDNDGREGDMSAINVDSDGTFWISNEIAEHNPGFGVNSWGTDIAHFSVGNFVKTQANSASTVYSTHTQTISLSATITDINSPGTPVNEGTVTFTIKNGGTVIGTAVGTVAGGAANATFTAPAGLAAGAYTIAVSYKDNSGFFIDLTDNSSTLTITPAKVIAAANNFFGFYSPNVQTLAFSANLTDTSISTDTVSEGVVLFTVTDGKGNLVGRGGGLVSGSIASGNFRLPAGEPLGTYTIAVTYADPSTGNFINTSDTSATLTLLPANIVTTASNISTAYSPNARTVKLIATLTDSSIPTDVLNEGTVTFTVTDSKGNLVGQPVTAAVSSGTASYNFNLAAGQALGSYTIAVSYNSASGHFADGGDTSGTLTIGSANVATTAGNLSAAYSPNTQTLDLSASVADTSIPSDTVGEGTVTFTITDKNGKEVGQPVTATVSGGLASTQFSLPAGQALGSYTITVSYSDSNGNFTDTGDASGTLTIGSANVLSTASPTNVTFNTADQTVTLNAKVVDNSIGADTVNEGIVTFTIMNGVQIVVRDIFGTVSNGQTSADFTWSGGRPAGNYTIALSYADSLGNFTDSGDTTSTLTVAAAGTTTTANSPPAVIASSAPQNVTLSANVASGAGTISEGTVTFKVTDKNGNQVGQAVTGNVAGGFASAVFSLPGGNSAGNYTINASYADSTNTYGLVNFSPSTTSAATTGTLTIQPAQVATTANSVSAIYSPNGQSLRLTASVANTSVPSNTVGEGTVTFTLTDKNGNQVGQAVTGNVTGGAATATLNLTAAQAVPGSYTLNVSYSDSNGSGNFTDGGDNGAMLTITSAKVTTKTTNVTTTYSLNTQTVTLNATVADASNGNDTVGEGVVTFTVGNGATSLGSVQANVTSGTASAQLTLPAEQALGNYTITVSYTDSSGNFTDIGDTGATLTITPAKVTTTASNVSAVYSPNGQTLAFSAAVTDTSIAADTVGEGEVTFTVANGSTALGSVQGSVTGGTANANFSLPAGQAAGSYTITVSYNDTTSHFLDAGDTGATLTITEANVTTTASNVTAAFSPNIQTLKLSANVLDASNSSDTVSQGSVTFTVTDNQGNSVGTATGLVSGGKANASLSWPAGQALGNYTITVSYTDASKNFNDKGDSGATLTVGPANAATTVNNVSTLYSANSQTVTLSANVADASVPSDAVTEGAVAFTIQSGSTTLGSVQATVINGTASAKFTLPAGLSAGSYIVAAHYSDSNGLFTDSLDTGGTLTVAPVSVTTTADSASTSFNTAAQTLDLSAAVADPGATNTAVNEGVVTFTLLSGSTVIGSVQGTVTGSTAHAAVTLPAGLSAANYVLAVHYSDSNGNFADSGDTNATLAVNVAATNAQLLQAQFSPNYTNLTVTETVTAHITSSTLVDRGTVTFTLSGQTITTNVDGNGNATIVLTLPMTNLLNPQSINASYTDSSHNLTSSTDTETAEWQQSSPLLPSYAGFSPNSVTMDLFGLLFTFTNGVLTEIDYGSIHVDFIYSAGGLAQITVDGIDLLP